MFLLDGDSISSFTLQPALITLTEPPPLEGDSDVVKVSDWEKHMLEYGCGVTMYRTSEISQLVLKGIPQHIRGEMWMIFSGRA